MAYNVTEERLKVKGSESITRDLQVNKTIYADNISVNNAQINELNVANIISNSIIENGNKVVNNSILGMNTSSVVFWNNTANQLQTLPVPQADNVVLTGNMDGSLRWEVSGGNVNGAPVIALNETYFVDVLDYNVDNGWDAGTLYMTTPNGNFYFGNYLYTPSAVYTTPTTVTMVFSNTGYSGTSVTLTLSSPDAVTNTFLGSSSIISATYKNGQPASLGVNMSLPGSCITNAKYLYVENAAYAFNGCSYMKDCFFFNESLVNNAPGGYNPWNMVTNASHMFKDCVNLTASFIIPQNITDAAYMYAGCYNMTSAVPRVPLIVSDTVTDMTRTFNNCRFFNQPITIGNNVSNMSYTFHNCTRFNQPITIGNSVTNMLSAFYNCFNFDQPLTVPSSVTDMSYTFFNCFNFNQPITVSDNVTGLPSTFFNCLELNQPITIGNNVTDMSSTFYNCTRFNQPITIPNSAINMLNTFRGCSNFNQPITIPDSVTDMSYTFSNCSNFNQPITIGNSVTNMSETFQECGLFNQSIIIPNSVTNMSHTFYNCRFFNQPITLSDNVTELFGTFSGCSHFNQPITIPNNVTELFETFSGCDDFNQPITIPNSVTSMYSTFMGCSFFNQPITIPDSVTDMSYTFAGCYSFNQSITIPENVTSLVRAFSYCETLNRSASVPIHISHNIVLGDTSNYIYNALVNSYTGINWTGRILNDA